LTVKKLLVNSQAGTRVSEEVKIVSSLRENLQKSVVGSSEEAQMLGSQEIQG